MGLSQSLEDACLAQNGVTLSINNNNVLVCGLFQRGVSPVIEACSGEVEDIAGTTPHLLSFNDAIDDLCDTVTGIGDSVDSLSSFNVVVGAEKQHADWMSELLADGASLNDVQRIGLDVFATAFLPRSVGRGGSTGKLHLSRGLKSEEPHRASENGRVLPERRHSSDVQANNDVHSSGRGGADSSDSRDLLEREDTLQQQQDDAPIPATFVAEANLPTDIGHFRMRAYRTERTSPFVGTEPIVIYAADKPPFGKSGRKLKEGVPVRVHDQCFTSEVFRSRRCDCKEQLKMSLEYIQKHGGAVIYLQQEGRGIGLANKVAAYALQDEGLDTVDANLHLGFPDDCRQYGAIPSILVDMGIGSIHLLTNNPRKVERLTALGVNVIDSRPMVVEKANPYNKRYLETKQSRMNHTNFGAMLRASADIVIPTTMQPGRSRRRHHHADELDLVE